MECAREAKVVRKLAKLIVEKNELQAQRRRQRKADGRGSVNSLSESPPERHLKRMSFIADSIKNSISYFAGDGPSGNGGSGDFGRASQRMAACGSN